MMERIKEVFKDNLIKLGILPSKYLWPNPFKIIEFNELTKDICLSLSDEVLDLGCGSGRQGCLLAKKAKRVIGIDISEPEIARANRYGEAYKIDGKVEFLCCGVEEANLEENRFDKAFSFCVLEHIPNYEEVFQTLFRVLKPGGKLAISVDSLATFTDKKILEKHKVQYCVYKYFTCDELESLLIRVGFRNVKIYPILRSKYSRKLFQRWLLDGFPFNKYRKFIIYLRLRWEERRSNAEREGIFLCAKALK